MIALISPSSLVVRAAGLKPLGVRKAVVDCDCAMCGITIEEGDLVDDFTPGISFTDYPALAAKSSRVICGNCKAVWRKEFMQKYSKAIICADGIYPFAKMENQAYWLLNPPITPYIAIHSDQQQQHLVWRAPVNYAPDIMRIQYGGTLLTIRRPYLLDAHAAATNLVETFNDGKKKGEQIKNPFARLDWKLESVRHGRLKREIIALGDEESKRNMMLLRNCTGGELWALCVLLSGKKPVQPEPSVTPATGLPKVDQP